MSDKNDPFLYDEDESVKFIQNYLPQEMKGKFTDDEINYVVDVIADYYQSKGLIDASGEDETMIDIDTEELVAYVIKNVKKDNVINATPEEITFIVNGELEYGDSLNMFD